MRLIVLLTLISLFGCASRPPMIQGCGEDPKLAREDPTPAPGMFDRCMTETEAYGRGAAPISQECSDFLRLEQTE